MRRAMDIRTGMGAAMITDEGLYKLMTWLSPNFPVGAFAYSHGLETAVETGRVTDAESLTTWIEGILKFGAGRLDAALFRAAFEAESARNDARLDAVVARGAARRGTAEMALESNAQGRAFLDALLKSWPQLRLIAWDQRLKEAGREPAYPIAVAVAAAIAKMAPSAALNAYLNAFIGNLVSAGLRLVPLGQTDGQRTLAALEDPTLDAVQAALRRDTDDFGAAAVTVDWLSMQHETQYTRLFRS